MPKGVSLPAGRTGGSCSDGLVAVVAARIITSRRVPIVSRRVAVRRITVTVRRITVTVRRITVPVAIRQRAADYACGDGGADPATQTSRLRGELPNVNPGVSPACCSGRRVGGWVEIAAQGSAQGPKFRPIGGGRLRAALACGGSCPRERTAGGVVGIISGACTPLGVRPFGRNRPAPGVPPDRL